MFPCRIFANHTLNGSMTNAVANLKLQGRMNIKFENSFDQIPDGNQPEAKVEAANPAVDEVCRFMEKYNFRLNNGNVYHKPDEGKNLNKKPKCSNTLLIQSFITYDKI